MNSKTFFLSKRPHRQSRLLRIQCDQIGRFNEIWALFTACGNNVLAQMFRNFGNKIEIFVKTGFWATFLHILVDLIFKAPGRPSSKSTSVH